MSLSGSHEYTSNEVERIIRRALRLKKPGLISHDDLFDMAKELGLDSQAVETAIEQEQKDIDLEKSRKMKILRRKATFHHHLWSYVIVICALILINAFTHGPWWFQWPMIGWGIGLAFHFRAAYFPTEAELDSELWNGDE
jgi:hypothetical protein